MTHEHPGDEHHEHEHEHGPQPSEEELRARLEEELRRITVRDVLLQTIVSLINLGGQRLGMGEGGGEMRDLEQVRLAIEGVRALLPLVEEENPEQVKPVRDALSSCRWSTRAKPAAARSPAGASRAVARHRGARDPRPGSSHGAGSRGDCGFRPGAPLRALRMSGVSPAPARLPGTGPIHSGAPWLPRARFHAHSPAFGLDLHDLNEHGGLFLSD
jgi:hypothetical protein